MTIPEPTAPRNDHRAYRRLLYRRYATLTGTGGDDGARASRPSVYGTYLRHWLPADPAAAILDVGCGSGRLLAFLRDRGYVNLAGVDVSPEQVELAQSRGLPAEHGDALEYLAGHVGSFDLIAAMDLVEHLSKDELLRFLDLAYGALRPGGVLVLQTPNPESPFFGCVRYGDLTHETALAPSMLCSLMGQTGFQDFALRETGPICHGHSIRSSLRWIAWRVLRNAVRLWHLVETGSTLSSLCTRTYLAKAVRVDRDA